MLNVYIEDNENKFSRNMKTMLEYSMDIRFVPRLTGGVWEALQTGVRVHVR